MDIIPPHDIVFIIFLLSTPHVYTYRHYMYIYIFLACVLAPLHTHVAHKQASVARIDQLFDDAFPLAPTIDPSVTPIILAKR